MQPEMTILMLVIVAFVAGAVGGLVLADAYDLEPHQKRRIKRQARRDARRQAANRRMDKMRKMPTFTIDKF
jgi:hypothetical protein